MIHGEVTVAVSTQIYAKRILLHTNLQAVAGRTFSFILTTFKIYFPPNNVISSLTSTSCSTSYYIHSYWLENSIATTDYSTAQPNAKGPHLRRYNLTILNSQATYFNFTHHTWSLLDLIISSIPLSSLFSIQYHPDLYGSNHTLLIELHLRPNINQLNHRKVK